MIDSLLSLYIPSYTTALVYMLQSTEYQAGPYLAWWWRTKDFRTIAKRRSLRPTSSARLLLAGLRLGISLQLVAGLLLIGLGVSGNLAGGVAFGAALIIVYPILWAHLLVLALAFGRWFVIAPKERQLIHQAEPIFANHPGLRIAVVGSYGKTTMKELLLTVLGEGKLVAATPANKNVAISHAYFSRRLSGKEELVIIEYGEGGPGDVARLASTTHPTQAIITGLAPAHLDHYKSLAAAGQDIFSISQFVPAGQVYVNADAASVQPFLKASYQQFTTTEALGWKIANVKLSLEGVSFNLKRGKHSLHLHSALLGQHQVTTLGFVAAFGLSVGLTQKQVIDGIAKTVPFEHRMQPYQLAGAWVIDDTYNGNIEGIRAGTQLLKALPAKRKIYITPGLVDQGPETEAVHLEMGSLIAAAAPDLVVLMEDSVTPYIVAGLTAGKYHGEIRLESQPLEFYTNLQQFVAAGDLVLMQNDWTDNYA